jgi:dienelactone hydrolase
MLAEVLMMCVLSQSERVAFDTPTGASLAARFVNAGPGTPGVLFFPMCRADAMDGWAPVAERLRAAGISSLTVAPRGFGGSMAGTYDRGRDQRANDADTALAQLRRRIGDDAPVAVAGSSCGVWSAMSTASRHRDVRAVVAFTGPHTDEQLEYVRKAPDLAVFSGAAELDTPAPDWARALKQASANSGSQLELVPGKAHGTDNFATNEALARRVAEWLAAQLKSAERVRR